jgi:hypothetical protein
VGQTWSEPALRSNQASEAWAAIVALAHQTNSSSAVLEGANDGPSIGPFSGSVGRLERASERRALFSKP